MSGGGSLFKRLVSSSSARVMTTQPSGRLGKSDPALTMRNVELPLIHMISIRVDEGEGDASAVSPPTPASLPTPPVTPATKQASIVAFLTSAPSKLAQDTW